MPTYEQTERTIEWDRRHHVAYAIKHRDQPAVATGASERPDDADIAWLPVVRELPDDYIENQPALLGPSVFVPHPDDDDKVIERYPDADFSPEAFKRHAENKAESTARAALDETDWMVIREVETGEPIPTDVRNARNAIRTAVDVTRNRLSQMSPAGWQDFDPVEVHNARDAQEKALERRRRTK